MRSAKLIIEGNYWDSQIYSGRLYLWDMENSIIIIDWNKVVNYLIHKFPHHTFGLLYSFKEGDFFYKNPMMLKDESVGVFIFNKLKDLTNTEFVITEQELTQFVINRQRNPISFLHTDTEILRDVIFTITDKGFFSTRLNYTAKRECIEKKSIKLTEQPFLSLKATNYAIALAGSEEGLYEYYFNEDLYNWNDRHRLKRLSEKHSTFVNYNQDSLYSSSYTDAYMAVFSKYKYDNNIDYRDNDFRKEKIIYEKENPKYIRKLQRIVDEGSIFDGNEGLSWGGGDKLYKVINNTKLALVKFNQNLLNKKRRVFDDINSAFTKGDIINFEPWKGDIISGGVSYWGIIIECENALVILKTDNEIENIPGDITKWKIFPRSKNYLNQLHIIFDNRMEIRFFSHDYFVNQEGKKRGLGYFRRSYYSY